MTEEPPDPLPAGVDGAPSQPLDERGPTSHYTLLYEDEDEQLAAVTQFLREGLRRGEQCIYILGERTEGELACALRSGGIDVAAARETGLLSFRNIGEMYLATEDPTPESLRDDLVALLDERDDEQALRITGEMMPALDAFSDPSTLSDYERYVDDIIEERANFVTGLCQYDRQRAPDDFLRNVVTHHPGVQTPRGGCTNVFYEQGCLPEADGRHESPLDRTLRTLDRLSSQSTHRTHLRRLGSLTESVRQLDEVDPSEILDILVDTLADVYMPAVTTVWSYDRTTGSLRPGETLTAATIPDAGDLLEGLSELAWETFTDDAFRTDALACHLSGDADAVPVDTCLSVSLGEHGVLMSLLPDRVGLSETDEAVLRTATTKARIALDVLSYRDEVRDHADELEERERRIERLERSQSVLRETRRRMIDATSRADLEQTVCERLVDSPLFDHAWIGEYDERTENITANYAAPDGVDWPMTEATADGHGAAPSIIAAEEREPVVRDDVYGDPPFEPWQEWALRRGLQSVASVPLLYKESLYGTLTVCSSDPGEFGCEARTELQSLGREVAHAINACETKEALISDEVSELTLRIRDRSLSTIHLASQLDTTVSFEGLVPRAEGQPRVYVTIRDCERSMAESTARRIPAIDELQHVSSRDGGHVFAFTVGDGCFFQALLEHGGVPSEVEASDGEARVKVELPRNASVRSFLSMLEERYREVDIRAQHSRERAFRTRDEFRAAFEQELTDRQREIVRTAYHSGFFEAPRESTGDDIANQLDVSQPTVTEHIRTAERELFTVLFESDES